LVKISIKATPFQATSVDQVIEVLKSVGEDLARDPDFNLMIWDSLEILGVDDFAESQVTIKIRIKTAPGKQWIIGRELRRRTKNTFDSRSLEIPFPHVSVYFGEASRPFDLAMQSVPKELLRRKATSSRFAPGRFWMQYAGHIHNILKANQNYEGKG
jgi:hypothetical protein